MPGLGLGFGAEELGREERRDEGKKRLKAAFESGRDEEESLGGESRFRDSLLLRPPFRR